MFYENLCALCAEKGEKITPVVIKLGFDRGNIARWRKGSSPTGDTLLKFAEYFGVSTDRLLKGHETLPTAQSTAELTTEDFLAQQGITDAQDIENIKHLLKLMRMRNHNDEIADEFVPTESSAR